MIFSSTVDKTHSSTSEISSVLFVNPAGSNRTVAVESFIFSTLSPALTSTIRVFLNPTVTANGNTWPVTNNDIGGEASVIQVFGGPSTSSSGARFCTYVVSTAGLTTLFVPLYQQLVIPPNTKILFTVQHDVSTSKTTNISIRWNEL